MDEGHQRERLGQLMLERRKERRLSVRAAAREAGIDRDTWADAENARRRISEHNYAGVEDALAWTRGSIDAILAGGAPAPREDGAEAEAVEGPDEEIDLVRSDPNLDDAMKAQIIELIRERRERDKAAAIVETRRLIGLFKGNRRSA